MGERLKQLLLKIKQGNPPKPSQVRIPDDHVDIGATFAEPFRPEQDYFTVQLNELLLQHARQWWKTFDPMAWVLTEFTYAGEPLSVPYVVGPNLLKQAGQPTPPGVPQGVIMRDIRVAGTYPYRGGQLALTLILYQVPQGDAVDGVLGVVETAARALDFSTQLGPYLKVADAVVDGLSTLLGINGVTPIQGCRHVLDADAGGAFRPGCYALLGPGAPPVEELWVREGRLLTGSAPATAAPVSSCDYLLYTLHRSQSRSDARSLPTLMPFWQRAERAAAYADDASIQVARTNLATLETELFLSPDLTRHEAEALYGEYHEAIKKRLDSARARAHFGSADDLDDELIVLRNIVSEAMKV